MHRCLRLLIVFIPVAAALAILLVPLPNRLRTAWVSTLFNLGHVPLFALLTVYLGWILGRRWWLAVGISITLACFGELCQIALQRSADVGDLLRGVLGSLLALVCLKALEKPRRAGQATLCAAAAAGLLIWPVADALPTLWDAYIEYRRFPIICSFETRWEANRWNTQQAVVRRVAVNPAQEQFEGQIDFLPGSKPYGAVVMFPVVRDWTDYNTLCCQFSFGGQPMTLLISVRDGLKVTPPLKRFDLRRTYSAGKHRVRIDLGALARGESFAPLDLSRIESLHLVVEGLDRQRTMRVQQIYLE